MQDKIPEVEKWNYVGDTTSTRWYEHEDYNALYSYVI